MMTKWAVVALTLMVSGPALAHEPPRSGPVLVYAHRGASALRPEHTLAAYALAIRDGADVVEPDLVSTRDGVLVARHENEIGSTTDVAQHPEFASRKTTKVVDGHRITGWFTEDFTLDELKTLRARERLPELRGTRWDGQFQLVTLDEIIDFVAAEAASSHRNIGLIPEIKHPSYFHSIGLPMEDKVLATLQAHAYTRTATVTIQSFETDNLRYLRSHITDRPNIRLLQLLDSDDATLPDATGPDKGKRYADLETPRGLQEVARYADAIGPGLDSIIPRTADGRLMTPTPLIQNAHVAGLRVEPYTFRPENNFLPAEYRKGTAPATRNDEGMITVIHKFMDAGVDAFFTDDPSLGRRVVDQR